MNNTIFSPNTTRRRTRRSRSRTSRQTGFTLLLAALVASIVLTLGASIFDIAQKQLTLSSIGRDSQFAFYAADTISECALYWDFRFSYFSATTPTGVNPTCDTKAITPLAVSPSEGEPYAYPYTLTSPEIDLFTDASPPTDYCAQVTVTKTLDPVTKAVKTTIHADGYSTSCDQVLTSQRALQRTVELNY